MEVEASHESVRPQNNSQLIKNVIFVGSTGSGKSTTCNYILGENHFVSSDEEVSCTFAADEKVCAKKGIRLFDTPGFGDNRFNEKQIDKIMRELTILISDPRVESTGQVDAFILPVKFNPRPATLKTDLEHFMDLFGTVAVKSLVLLFIFDSPNKSEDEVLKTFGKMQEIVNIIKQGKKEELNASWFCIWDNLNPRPNQEQELFQKIQKLEPYTHKKFLEADKEIKARLDEKVKAEVERLVNRVKKDHEDDKKMQEVKIKEIHEAFSQERKELQAARDRAQNNTAQFVKAMQKMGEDNKKELQEMYTQMRKEREDNNDRAMKMIEQMQDSNNQQIQSIMEQNNQVMETMQRQMQEIANRKPEVQVVERVVEKRGGCNLF